MSYDPGPAFRREMKSAKNCYETGELGRAQHHLERAHILGQLSFWRHMRSHWWMLKVAVRQAAPRAVVGQLFRMTAVVPGYVFGWVPLGNTGGTDVSPIRPMPLPADLAPIFEGYSGFRTVVTRLLLLAGLAAGLSSATFLWRIYERAGETKSIASRIEGICTKLDGFQAAEDLVLDSERRVVYAVGGDRRSFRSGGPGRARIWSLPLDHAERATPVDIAPSIPETFRSFGASLHISDGGVRRLFVANRPAERHSIEIFLVEPGGALRHERTLHSPLLVNPNDVAAIGEARALVTLDKVASAGSFAEVVEGALQSPSGRVLLIDNEGARIVADGLLMANGIGVSPDGGTVYVGETVGGAISVFDRDAATDSLKRRSRIALGSGVDNLTVDAEGRVFAAAHPKLLSLAMGYQRSEQASSPSQVFEVDGNSGVATEIFSSSGAEIKGSSVAVVDAGSGRMLIGSAFGPHILSCVDSRR